MRNSVCRKLSVVLIVVALFGAATAATAALSQYSDTRANVASRCLLDGDHQGVALSEAALLESHITAYPAGRLCVWRAAEGGVIRHQSGWPTTVVATIGAAWALFGTVCAFSVGVGRSAKLTAAFSLACVALAWCAIVVQAIVTIDAYGPN